MLQKQTARVAMALIAGATILFGQPARAQMGGQNVPDLSGFADQIAQSMASPGADTAKPAADGTFQSGLKVPSVKPGSTAQNIGKQLRESIEQKAGPQPAFQTLEKEMPKALTGVEDALQKVGMSKRDMGVAIAFAFITFWETANKQEIPLEGSKSAGKAIAAAVAKNWKPKYSQMEPATQEKIYETLLISPTLLSTFASQFDKAGKTQEADGMRQTAGQLFQKLTGSAADQITISPEGKISGLSADKQ